MASSLIDQWFLLRDELLTRQVTLLIYFEEKVASGEQVSDYFKDGLRFATFVKILLQLVLHPVNLQESYDKALEIYTVFLEAEFIFDDDYISTLVALCSELQVALEWNEEITEADFIHAYLSEPDPAKEDDDMWVHNLTGCHVDYAH